jgi:enterochelin esterase-like enzyme
MSPQDVPPPRTASGEETRVRPLPLPAQTKGLVEPRVLFTMLRGHRLSFWLAGLIIALLAPMAFALLGTGRAIIGEMISLSFDVERASFIAALGVALLSSALTGFLSLRRSAAWLGAFLWFAVSYVWNFASQAQQPPIGPDGQAQTLAPHALTGVLLGLLAVGLLVTAAGATLGEATGRLLFPPLGALGAALLARIMPAMSASRADHADHLVSAPAVRALATAILLGVALAVGGSQLGAFLTFGVSNQLYEAPAFSGSTGRQHSREHGAVRQGVYSSAALGGERRPYSIYLPSSYDTFPDRRYPVLYLLHGSPGDHTNWFDAGHAVAAADALFAEGAMRETILVAPDGNGAVYRVSAWANSHDKRQRMEDSIATDLVSAIDSQYRTLPDRADRAIGGLSEGGYAAANIALHHPDVFGAAVPLSGYFVAENSSVFGPGPATAPYRTLNSPALYVQTPEGKSAARQVSFVIGVGTGDGTFYKAALAFAAQLRALGASVAYLEVSGGHSWTVWGQLLGQALRIVEPAPRWSPGHDKT